MAEQGSTEAIDSGSNSFNQCNLPYAGQCHRGRLARRPGQGTAFAVRLEPSAVPAMAHWPSLGPEQVFPTEIRMKVPLDDINVLVRVLPHQLHQHVNAI
jgi:hypothetical protein